MSSFAAPERSATPRSRRGRFSPAHLLVITIAGCSLYLGLANIETQGFANYYYAAAVRSMTQNWRAFYFVSLDPHGFVSIDKPPLAFWIQTASAMLFGYHGWAILLPQAIAAAIATVLLYTILQRFFGATAGIIGALVLAISPINVAVARNNTPDGLLVLALLLATFFIARAVQNGRGFWLTASFAMVGIGFNIKMMEAYLILPGLVVSYLFSNRIAFWRKVVQLTAATLTLVFVSFAWATTVWLTPATDRPYVGSTDNNNVFSLIFGYNGINRLLPKNWSIFGVSNGLTSSASALTRGSSSSGRMGENGPQGVFRLLDRQLSGQAGWLLLLAAAGLIAGWGRPRLRRLDERQTMLLMFGLWAVVEVVFFSVAGFYHRYYLSTLSPSIAALSGVGAVSLWGLVKSSRWTAALLPIALGASAVEQLHVLSIYPFWRSKLEPVLVAATVIAVAAVITVWLAGRSTHRRAKATRSIVSLVALTSLFSLFAGPAIWSYTTIQRGYQGALPIAGPNAELNAPSAKHSRSSGQSASLDAVVHTNLAPKPLSALGSSADDPSAVIMNYLNMHRGGAAYVVAVSSSREADPIIVNTGEPVMTLGGFSGEDPI